MMEEYKESAETNLLEQQKREARIRRDSKIMAWILGIITMAAIIGHLMINYYDPDNSGTGMGMVIGISTILLCLWFFLRNYEIKLK